MYAVIEVQTDSRSPNHAGPVELARFLTHRQAEKAIADLYLAGRYDRYVERLIEAPVWVERVYDVLDAPQTEIGCFRVARDGRSFIQVGRRCVWGRKGESEASLRWRKDAEIENA